jgi:hypothetical protein
MRALTPLALAELDTAPMRIVTSAHIAGTAHAVFAELGDPSKWFPMMRRSVWISAETGGLGAQREVVVRGLGAFRERMIAWDDDRRVAFTMTATSSPLVHQLGEDFRIAPEGDGVRLDWAMAARPTLLGRALEPATRVMMRRIFAVACKRLGELVVYSRHERVA